jgi:hypothetical protein
VSTAGRGCFHHGIKPPPDHCEQAGGCFYHGIKPPPDLCEKAGGCFYHGIKPLPDHCEKAGGELKMLIMFVYPYDSKSLPIFIGENKY